ncbi:MAG: CaiB/BaiF CoA-transferase family protein [Myxococcota bacterium]|nr:CaiB/BaiF CoA-transferase family protein [Myxococcota bacterium]
MSQTGALSHVRVLDLSRILAGPWATQSLGDLGADIIKVERPGGGDDTRSWGPPYLADDSGRSAYFCSVNRNKRSLGLDLSTDEGAQILRNIAKESQVLVENFKQGGLARYGLDYESLRKENPSLVYCSITGFGQEGPEASRAGYDFMIQGMAGLMSVTGEPEGMPMKVGVALSDILTGLNAAVAILAALNHAERTGEGQFIDMSLFDVTVASLANQAANHLFTGEAPERLGNAHPNIVPYQAFETADGHVILAVGNDGQFKRFCALAGVPSLAEDDRFATNDARVRNRNELVPQVAAVLKTRATSDWLEALHQEGVPAGPINDIGQAFAEDQAQFRDLATQIEDDRGVAVPIVRSPLRLSATPPVLHTAPPRVGQHTLEILSEVAGLGEEAIRDLDAQGIISLPDVSPG